MRKRSTQVSRLQQAKTIIKMSFKKYKLKGKWELKQFQSRDQRTKSQGWLLFPTLKLILHSRNVKRLKSI